MDAMLVLMIQKQYTKDSCSLRKINAAVFQKASNYSSSISLCLPSTFLLNSSGSLSHNSAASPLRGDALQ